MPPRLERRQQTGNLHFITFSCHNRNPYLATPRAASLFEHSLESMRENTNSTSSAT
jgi:putative transposase